MIGPYKFRIIIPILQRGKLASFQGRDYTGRSDLRYKTCEKEKEVVCHKHLLYNADAIPGEDVVVVEGVTDVWRLGPGSVATFGTGFTQEQVMILAGYRRVFLLYDGEEAATRRADKLAHAISGLGAEVELVTLDGGDPAEMSQDDADYMMLELGLFK
jgi:DNA primase